jgi:hypothetical protein
MLNMPTLIAHNSEQFAKACLVSCEFVDWISSCRMLKAFGKLQSKLKRSVARFRTILDHFAGGRVNLGKLNRCEGEIT